MPVDPLLDAWLVEPAPADGRAAPTTPTASEPFETRLPSSQAPDGGSGFRVDPNVLAPVANAGRGIGGELRAAIARMVPESTDDQRALPDWRTPAIVATLGNEWFEALTRLAADFDAFAGGLDDVAKGYTAAETTNTATVQGR